MVLGDLCERTFIPWRCGDTRLEVTAVWEASSRDGKEDNWDLEMAMENEHSWPGWLMAAVSLQHETKQYDDDCVTQKGYLVFHAFCLVRQWPRALHIHFHESMEVWHPNLATVIHSNVNLQHLVAWMSHRLKTKHMIANYIWIGVKQVIFHLSMAHILCHTLLLFLSYHFPYC